MTDTLKERLDKFNAAILMGKPPYICSTVTAAEYVFLKAVGKAYRTGDLVTKEGLEAAVAKAVAKEREACAEAVEDNAYGQFDDKTGITWCDKDEAIGVIRARGEGK